MFRKVLSSSLFSFCAGMSSSAIHTCRRADTHTCQKSSRGGKRRAWQYSVADTDSWKCRPAARDFRRIDLSRFSRRARRLNFKIKFREVSRCWGREDGSWNWRQIIKLTNFIIFILLSRIRIGELNQSILDNYYTIYLKILNNILFTYIYIY